MRRCCAALLPILVLVLAGCSRDGSTGSELRIAGMVFQEDQFFRLVLFGMRDAAQAAAREGSEEHE